jgi:hypothetical protein
MQETNKHKLTGFMFGVAGTILAAALVGIFPILFHWVRNDTLISESAQRLNKIEPIVDAIKTDLASFHADHAALRKEVDDNHNEEMQAINRLFDKVDAAAQAASVAAERAAQAAKKDRAGAVFSDEPGVNKTGYAAGRLIDPKQ